MKKILSIVCLLASFATIQAQDNIEKIADYPTGYIKGAYPYYYGSQDGVLYVFLGSEPTILVRFPANDPRESFTIPNSVTRIAKGAFKGSRNLKEVILPASVIYIGDDAFDDTEIESFVVAGNDITSHAPAKEAQGDSPVRYYDMSGRPLAAPSEGITLAVEGEKATKLLTR